LGYGEPHLKKLSDTFKNESHLNKGIALGKKEVTLGVVNTSLFNSLVVTSPSTQSQSMSPKKSGETGEKYPVALGYGDRIKL